MVASEKTLFIKQLAIAGRNAEVSGQGKLFDDDVPERDEYSRRYLKVRRIRNSTWEQAANSFFVADEKNSVFSVFDHSVLEHTDK